MDEFSLIDAFFKSLPPLDRDVLVGIGDDAAVVSVPENQALLISTDTLVAEVHFHSSWDPYDIACKAVRVNVSDIAAMGGTPRWLTLALTLPELNIPWLERFSQGLRDSLAQFNLALIGGDTTKGPLSMTLTIHGLASQGQAVKRSGAQCGDTIYVSGELGAAALALNIFEPNHLEPFDNAILMQKLKRPNPRVDFSALLHHYATAAIDISDGLSADLNHICKASQVGACMDEAVIPLHPLLNKHQPEKAMHLALSGGDDYELCFTVSSNKDSDFLTALKDAGLNAFPIGVIEKERGLRMKKMDGATVDLTPRGYSHF